MDINKTTVTLQLHASGYCTHREFVTISGGSWGHVRYPAGYAVIEHPQHGILLFDTGYASRFLEATRPFPYSLYAKTTPVCLGESAASQLQRRGVRPEDVKRIIVSHFHGDHIAGLRDFPNAEFMASRKAYEAVKRLKGVSAVRRGFVPALLPDDFEHRLSPIEETPHIALPEQHPFHAVGGYDLFADGSLIAVDVSGHAEGQFGLFLRTARNECFLCADAVWSSAAYREERPPHPAAGLIMPSRRQYRESFLRLVELHKRYPDVRIIPSHCMEAWSRHIEGGEPL
ncbi:MBL fold metallo-hydrolase [Paenibacillus sp. J5C_2022]|uniref:MBL fold metallo-hydrolase n=1 Tax=Paenibacillus sp. J5C2022 TaxID=2977129 RepID=UPI0021D2C171|nr:MBL fold metallo-hydrolase [Paenibacillus sp. J5C2022]MCU6709900.1 MBL fold metallo-hydrolase [Paenibacillus sp. J5C2022]